MNKIQKAYDSYDKTNSLLKGTNSYYHFRNLELIRNRKSQFSSPKKYEIKKKFQFPYQNYYIKKSNEEIKEKLRSIRERPLKTQENTLFKEKEEKIKDFKRQCKYLQDKELKEQNIYYKKRIEMQKAFIDPVENDKKYAKYHDLMMTKLRKVEKGDTIILPKIPKYTGRTKTETDSGINKKSDKNDKKKKQNQTTPEEEKNQTQEKNKDNTNFKGEEHENQENNDIVFEEGEVEAQDLKN